MDTTMLVASLVGPAIAVAGLGIFMNKKHYKKMMESVAKEGTAMYMAGLIAFVFGMWVVSGGSSWTLDAAGLVTLLGWGALLKGAAILALPDVVSQVAKTFSSENMMMGAGAAAVVIGAYLTYVAYFMVEVAEVVVPAV